jgi:curli biogenesis system outer membrane secretion channel CsgG
MFRSQSTARRLCLIVLLLAIAALCTPPSQSSAATPGQSRQVMNVPAPAVPPGLSYSTLSYSSLSFS